MSENTDHVVRANTGSQQVGGTLTVKLHAEEWRGTILVAVGRNGRSVTFDLSQLKRNGVCSKCTAYQKLSNFPSAPSLALCLQQLALTSRPAGPMKKEQDIYSSVDLGSFQFTPRCNPFNWRLLHGLDVDALVSFLSDSCCCCPHAAAAKALIAAAAAAADSGQAGAAERHSTAGGSDSSTAARQHRC